MVPEPVVTIWWTTPSTEGSGLLSPEEGERIARLEHADDRARAITSRALLRVVCAAAFGIEPGDVALAYRCAVCGGPHGRPQPVPPRPLPALHVSAAHSGGLVLLAATASGPVGLDVERGSATAFSGFDAVAMTERERAEIGQLPVAERARARTRAWVRKEARLKRDGVGLSVSPSDVDVSDDISDVSDDLSYRVSGEVSDSIPGVNRPGGHGFPAAEARLTDLEAAAFDADPDYQAALATTGTERPRIAVIDAGAVLARAAGRARTARA